MKEMVPGGLFDLDYGATAQMPDAVLTRHNQIIRQTQKQPMGDDAGPFRQMAGEGGGGEDGSKPAIQNQIILVGAGVIAVRATANNHCSP